MAEPVSADAPDRPDRPLRTVHIALSEHPHDRIGERRTDDAWLAEVWADPATRVLVLAGSKLRVERRDQRDHVVWVPPDGAPDGRRVLLGERNGVVHLAVLADRELAGDDSWVVLRQIVQSLETEDAPLVLHAIGLAEWHQSHRHCPRCGGVLESRQSGHQLECTECGRQQFPRTDPAVIMVVTDGEPPYDRCLLGRQASWPAGRYSTLAGFVEPGESLEDAVRREVLEEAGIRVGEVTYIGNQPWPFPASLMVGFTGKALTTEIAVDGAEIEHARWFTREEMRAETDAGTLELPGGISISRSLVEAWYGGPLSGQW